MKRLTVLVLVSMFITSDAHAETFRIATYNLNWGNQRGDQVLDAIATAKPDVICFQETTPQSEGFLQRQLRGTYPYFYASGHQGQFAAERLAFASKTELTNLKFHPPVEGLFGFYSARLQIAERDVHLVNVHLDPFRVTRNIGFRDAMVMLSKTEKTHEREIARILKTIDPRKPTIVIGDFNSLSKFTAPTQLRELGMIDAFAAVHDDADNHPTWTWPTRPLPLTLRIDYIFHTDHFQTTAAKIVRREGSDHSLLVASLKLK